MNKILITLAILLSPLVANAQITATWRATSTTQETIFPNKINNIEQSVMAKFFTASSTTGTSTFAGRACGGTSHIGCIGDTGAGGLWAGNFTSGSLTTRLSSTGNGIGLESFSGVQSVKLLDQDSGLMFNVTDGTTLFTVAGNGYGTYASGGPKYVFLNGNLGIGTTSPYAALSVVGETVASYFTATSSTATSTFRGSVAIGDSKVYAETGDSSLAVGRVTNSNAASAIIASSTPGSIAMGNVGGGSNAGMIVSTGGGSLAGGSVVPGAAGTASIQALGRGCMAWGYVPQTNNTICTGDASFALGSNVQARANFATAIGTGFTNSTASTFQVGYGGETPMLHVEVRKVAVGTTTPYSRLTVFGLGTGEGQTFEVANSASTTLMKVNDNGNTYLLGNVGIGTTSPYAKLSVVGETVAQNFTATSTTATSTFFGGSLFGTTGQTRILNNGYFSIGSTTPDYKLTVVETDSNKNAAAIFQGYSDGGFGTKGPVEIRDETGLRVLGFGHSNLAGSANSGSMNFYGNVTSAFNGYSFGDITWFNVSGEATSDLRMGTMRIYRDGGAYQGTFQVAPRTSSGAFAPPFIVKYNGNAAVADSAANAYSRFSVAGSGTGKGQTFELYNSASSTLQKVLDDGTTYILGNTGIGTTSPYAKLSVTGVSGAATNPLLLVASSTNTPVFTVNGAGHVTTGGGTPTVSSCGTGPSVSGNDTSGTVTVGTGVVTACTITFATPRLTTPRVVGVVTGGGLNITGGYSAKSTTAVTFSFAATIAAGSFDYYIVE